METCTLGIFNDRADVVVFGATPGGIMAAIRAKRNGSSVLLIEPTDWVGGLVSGGIAATDYNCPNFGKGLLVGLASEFYARMGKKYNVISQQDFAEDRFPVELWRAKACLQEMLTEAGIKPVFNCELVSATVTDSYVTAIKTSRGTFFGGAFIDATYEGDLLAAAGVTTTVGREAAATYSETYGGVKRTAITGVDPFITPGDSESGLIYGVEHLDVLISDGAADSRVQAVTYRFAATKTGDKVPFPEPTTYDATQYEGVARYVVQNGGAWTLLTDILTRYTVVTPNYDINNKGPFSTNWIGIEATEWVTASYARRREIQAQVRNWVLGLLKFIQTDSRIPAAVRADVASYGCPTNEHAGTGDHFPDVLYVREGRRMVGDFVLTEGDITAANSFADPIGFVVYNADSHFCRRFEYNGTLYQEGDTYIPAWRGAYIPMRVLLPKSTDPKNIIPTFAVSASHVAFCSLRMEPVHMELGDTAGAIAAMAVQRGMAVQDVPYADVKSLCGIGAKYLQRPPGSVLINADGSYSEGTLTKSGTDWTTASTSENGCHCKAIVSAVTSATAKFYPKLYRTTKMRVFLRYPVVPGTNDSDKPGPAHASRALATPVTIVSLEGTTSMVINQRGGGGGYNNAGGDWDVIGEFTFRLGNPSADYVQIGTMGDGSGSLIAAVMFQPIEGINA